MSIVFDITIFPLVFIQLNWRRSFFYLLQEIVLPDTLQPDKPSHSMPGLERVSLQTKV